MSQIATKIQSFWATFHCLKIRAIGQSLLWELMAFFGRPIIKIAWNHHKFKPKNKKRRKW